MEPFLLALGYGGATLAAGKFEWDFRVYIGAEDKADEAGRDEFLAEFRNNGTEGGSYAILVEEEESPLVETFMEFGKRQLAQNPDLWLFLVVEDTQNPEVQYKILIEADPIGELFMPNQIHVDIADTPKEVMLWLYRKYHLRFYEKDGEYMVEYPVDQVNP
ncbi:MAG: hypothetical protein JWN30_1822 [Bacilli bacterium]|nr:hypothetical protein [Bacilli bacterium]